VANTLGFTVVVAPWAALLGAWVWLLIFGIVRVPFVGSFGMVVVLCGGLALAAGFEPWPVTAVVLLLAAILLAHRANLAGLRSRKPPLSESGHGST